MKIEIEVKDEDLDFLFIHMRTGSLTVNRYNKEHCESISRLERLCVVEQLPYYGENVCYHPSYRLTQIGKLANAKWTEQQASQEH